MFVRKDLQTSVRNSRWGDGLEPPGELQFVLQLVNRNH